MKDLDEVFNTYITKNKFSVKSYQLFLDNLIDKYHKSNIIFVGLNRDMGRSDHLYDLRATISFFIDIPLKINLERLFTRDINMWLEWMINRDKNILFKQLCTDQKSVITGLTNSFTRNLNLNNISTEIKSFTKQYKDYTLLSSDKIYKNIITLI